MFRNAALASDRYRRTALPRMLVFTSKLGFSTRNVSRLTPSHVARLVGVAVGFDQVLIEEMDVLLDSVVGEAVGEGLEETLEDVTTEELAMLLRLQMQRARLR